MKCFRYILVGLLLIQTGFLASQDALPLKVNGTVKDIDLDLGTITVQRKGATVDESFNLLKRDIAATDSSGRKVSLAAVKRGQTIQLSVGATGDVEAVVIQASVFLTTVSDVDLERRTITIAGSQDQLAMMTVDPAAKIVLADRAAYLREIKPGSEFRVTPSLDGKTALALNLVSDPDGRLATKLFPRIKKSRLPGTRLVGILTDIDPAKSELQLMGPKTKGVPKSMPVAKDAVIKIVHGEVPVQDLTLRQVAKLSHATVTVSPQGNVTHIIVDSPVVQAKVKALDADIGQLTAEVEGVSKTFLLPRTVKVMDRSRVRRLGDLQPDLAVNLLLSLDGQQLLAIDVSLGTRK